MAKDAVKASELEKQFEKAAGDLAIELATIHGVLLFLIAALRETELSSVQSILINAAESRLRFSQEKFFTTYAPDIGGAAPDRN